MQIQVIDDVDRNIFRSTHWTEDLVNLGLSIRNVNFTAYNIANTLWLGRGDEAL